MSARPSSVIVTATPRRSRAVSILRSQPWRSMRETSSVMLGGRTPVALARSLRRHARSSWSNVRTVAWDGVSTSCCIRRVRNCVILTIRKPSCFASPRAVNGCRSIDGFTVFILLGYLIFFLLSRENPTYFLKISKNNNLGILILYAACFHYLFLLYCYCIEFLSR